MFFILGRKTRRLFLIEKLVCVAHTVLNLVHSIQFILFWITHQTTQLGALTKREICIEKNNFFNTEYIHYFIDFWWIVEEKKMKKTGPAKSQTKMSPTVWRLCAFVFWIYYLPNDPSVFVIVIDYRVWVYVCVRKVPNQPTKLLLPYYYYAATNS